ncbi:hypothetical protein [Mucilaginibacter rubeus]|uniref:Uncharacterized protein n=1 Tax=Mucilaginibacter rubeus TaxID=2027860 RepID=A0A5C1I312_9SPHI|nr:hypothetical protein [Mucilaginibacter rubeus]QEM12592.1 hypothetical protein DEO27_022115 [Mucilaginibacter rubeus]
MRLNGCGDIVFVNPQKALEVLKQQHAGQMIYISAEDIELRAYDLPALPELNLPGGFPECCEGHRQMYQSLRDEFDRFPNCCKWHSTLIGTPWFNKGNYLYMPMKVMNSFAYTISFIKEYMNVPDWHKRIKDYIDTTINSFGQFPLNFGPPLGLSQYVSIIQDNLPLIDELATEKHLAIENMLSGHARGDKEKGESDFQLLMSIYNEWLRIFPFEIPYLQPLRNHLENTIPVIKEKLDTNMFTGHTSYSLRSKAELLDFIKKATTIIITDLNAAKLYEKGELTAIKETALKLLTANRRIEIEELQLPAKSDQNAYLKLLKKWLKGEKKFITELRLTIGDETQDVFFQRCLCDAIHSFQRNETNEPCLLNVRNNGPNRESMVRYAVKNFLSARFPDAILTAEEEKDTRFMDLKFYHSALSHKVIEFKGWWNQDKKNIPLQLSGYLTDFEKDGYVFMINHLKSKNIMADYKALVQQENINFVPNSWQTHKHANLDFEYFSSKHQFDGREKTLFHFIFNVYF